MEWYGLVRGKRGPVSALCDRGMGMSNQLSAALGGADKAAVVLLALGSDQSAALLSGLKPEETALLSERLSQLADVDVATRGRVMEEFRRAIARQLTPSIPASGASAPAVRDPLVPPLEPPGVAPTAGRAGTHADGVRKFDLACLERVPPGVATGARPDAPGDLALPGGLTVRCQAELATLSLPVRALGDLSIGDVLLLKPGSDGRVELVGGEGCRLPGALREIDGQRAVEILGDAGMEEEEDASAAPNSTSRR